MYNKISLPEQVGADPLHAPIPSVGPSSHVLSGFPPDKAKPLSHAYVAVVLKSNVVVASAWNDMVPFSGALRLSHMITDDKNITSTNVKEIAYNYIPEQAGAPSLHSPSTLVPFPSPHSLMLSPTKKKPSSQEW